MILEETLAEIVVKAVKTLYDIDTEKANIQLQKTRKEFAGDVTVVTFSFVKQARKSPEIVGKELGEYICQNFPLVSEFNVIKGFLNLTINVSYWLEKLEEIDAEEKYGFVSQTEKSPLVMVEYSSPNTNKPLHLGHIRNNLLGFSLSEILKANGNNVVKTNIVNDRGIHICKSMLAWQKFGNNATPDSLNVKVRLQI